MERLKVWSVNMLWEISTFESTSRRFKKQKERLLRVFKGRCFKMKFFPSVLQVNAPIRRTTPLIEL